MNVTHGPTPHLFFPMETHLQSTLSFPIVATSHDPETTCLFNVMPPLMHFPPHTTYTHKHFNNLDSY